jgi:hypothetical protein
MPYFKATWFFTDIIDTVGWTENWWVFTTDAAAALTVVSNYATVRAALLLDSTSITAIRVSSVGMPRDSLYLGTGLPVAGTIGRISNPLAGVWDVLLCRRDVANNNLLGHMSLHMVPGSIFAGRVYVPGGASSIGWAAKFTAFGVEVTNGNYLLRQKSGVTWGYIPCTTFLGVRRSERRLGRPFDGLRGRRLVA